MNRSVITLALAFSMALAFLAVAGLPSMSGAGSCPDVDSDTVCDPDDNCLIKSNVSQNDSNSDGYGNTCDSDWDNNGVTGISDLGIWKVHFGHMTGDDPTDADVDYDELPNGAVGITDLGGWKVGFGKTPGPSGKACADPTIPGSCP